MLSNLSPCWQTTFPSLCLPRKSLNCGHHEWCNLFCGYCCGCSCHLPACACRCSWLTAHGSLPSSSSSPPRLITHPQPLPPAQMSVLSAIPSSISPLFLQQSNLPATEGKGIQTNAAQADSWKPSVGFEIWLLSTRAAMAICLQSRSVEFQERV